jgi:peptide chain release factor subunit 1
MPLDELLKRLVQVSPGPNSFLSVYLDLRPDGSGKKLHAIFLKSRLPELSKHLPPHSREQSLLARDIKRFQKYLDDDLDPAWKGMALFACASEDVFLPLPMPLPPENALHLSSFPHLFSLVRQADLYRSYGIIVANSRQSRLFLVSEGRPEKQTSLSWEDKHTTRFGRMALSWQKFQRHLQEHVRQRAKAVLETLEKLVGRKKIEHLFTILEEGMEAEIRKQLPASLKKKQIPLPSLDPHDPDHRILSEALETLQTISREKAETLARQILEEAQPRGQATVGPEPTLSALQNHQIERMILDARFKAYGWRCTRCGFLGMGGVPRVCPLCQGEAQPSELREEMVRKALSQGLELSFTENFSPLMKAGGTGALLKFKIPAKTAR